ncbi:GvpL/GvpF family gas vesicle protein [Rhodoflexus sp.]
MHYSSVYVYGIADAAFPLDSFGGKVNLIAVSNQVNLPLYLIVSKAGTAVDPSFHQEVLLRAGQYTGVVPVFPGVTLSDPGHFLRDLLTLYPQISDKINLFRNTNCWHLALYLADEFAFYTAIKHPELEQIDLKSLTAPPSQLQELRSKREAICRRLLSYETTAITAGLVNRLEGIFSYIRSIPLVHGALSGRSNEMIGRFAMLVPQVKTEKVGLVLQQARHELHPKGIHLELSGPWPPYFFMD